MTNCTINLNSDGSGNFYTGNIVTGIVVLELQHDLKIERIDFEVIGLCKAQWTRPKPTIPYIQNYSEKQKVLSIKIENIFGDVCNGKLIPIGVHRYPFHFALPEDLPTTFKSSIAKTTYKIKVKSKPSSKIRKIVPFNVLGSVNLNHLDDCLKPLNQEFQKPLSCNSGIFAVTVKTYKAFATKQKVPFEITLHNDKNIRINKLNVTLLQKLRYTVTSGYADEERKICKVTYKDFSHAIAEVCYFSMDMPQLIPTSLNVTDPLINISYIFRVEITFPFHFTIFEDIPVIVATVPVVHYQF